MRDRTECLLRDKEVKASDHFNYFNAGFMVSNVDHRPLFERCKKDAPIIPRKYYDQCVWNNLVEKMGIEVKYLHRIFNTMDMGSGLYARDTVGFHHSYNYEQYNQETVIGYCAPEESISDFLIRQQEQAGLYRLYSGPAYKTIHLHPDGTTSDGTYWVDRGKGIKMFNITGHDQINFDKLVRLD